MSVPELRVHGVSGTPPRDMLYTDPIESHANQTRSEQSQRYVKVYRKTSARDLGVGRSVRAFHWGGLTSGSWLTAFWVLMLPFSMANVAGWASRRRTPARTGLVRVFGLLLTGVFINMVTIATLDIYWQWSSGDGPIPLLRSGRPWWAVAILLLLGWLWWGVVSWASTRSHFSRLDPGTRRRLLWHPDPGSMLPEGGPSGDEAWLDPAGSPVTDPAVWKVHPILHRLRRIHLGFGYQMLAFAALSASDTPLEIPGWNLFDIPTGLALLALLVAVYAIAATGRSASAGRGLRLLTSVQPLAGVALLLVGSTLIGLFGVEASNSGHWPHLRDTSAVLLGVVTVVLALVWMAAGRVTTGALVLAVFFGLVMGAGAVFGLEGLLGPERVQILGLDWLAVGVLVWLLTLVVAVVVAISSNVRTGDPDLWDAIHDTTGSLGWVFSWISASALALAALAIVSRCGDLSDGLDFGACFQTGELGTLPPWLGGVTVGLAILAWLAMVVMLGAARRWSMGIGVSIAVPLAVWILRSRSFDLAGVELSLRDLETAARTFAIALPSALIISRIVTGLRGDVESRRGIGVVWDVVMFWPRWFHPLAPPAYGPHAVTRLREEISRRLLPDEHGTNTRPLILAAHSQGTIISTIALATMAGAGPAGDGFTLGDPAALDRLGWITYGCPLVHLYDSYFPSARFEELAEALAAGLGAGTGSPPTGRWANLHRPTDPIGGPVLPSVNVFIPDPVAGGLPSDPEPRDSPISALGLWLRRVMGKPEPPPKPIYRGHSRYEPTPEYLAERARIESLL